LYAFFVTGFASATQGSSDIGSATAKKQKLESLTSSSDTHKSLEIELATY